MQITYRGPGILNAIAVIERKTREKVEMGCRTRRIRKIRAANFEIPHFRVFENALARESGTALIIVSLAWRTRDARRELSFSLTDLDGQIRILLSIEK